MMKLMDCPRCGMSGLVIQEIVSGGVESIHMTVKCGGRLENSTRVLDGCGRKFPIFYQQTFFGLEAYMPQPLKHKAKGKVTT